VYLCCPGCSESLKADPDKYFKKAAEMGVLFENVQTTCPVGGEELKSKEIYSDYEGRRLVFCNAGCRDAFHKDPAKYLKAMSGAARVIEKKDTKACEGDGRTCKGRS
jgi:YHS domain-containing protein